MSGKMVRLVHNEKWGWYFRWGSETFYNGNREMMTWPSSGEAIGWLRENYPALKLVAEDLPDPVEVNQLPLFGGIADA